MQSFASYTPSHQNSPLERGGSEADGVCCAQQISPPLLHKNSPTLWVNILALEAHSEHYSSSNNSSFGLNFADGMKEVFKTTSASGGGDNYYGSGTSYTRPQFDVGGTFLAQGNNMNLEGMIHAKDMDIDLSGDLNITTVLDSYKGRGDGGNLSFSTDNVNFNINDKKDDKLWANADQVAGLYASNTADINVDGTTTLIGGVITADELNLTTSDLVVKDLKIHDTSKDVSIGVGVNLNNFDDNKKNDTNSYGNINYKDKGHTLEGEINSTIASNSGTITIGGKQLSDTELEARGVNTDFDKIHIITKDENWDRDLSAELVNMGVAKEQVKDITNAVKSITATVPDKIKAQGPNAENLYRKGIANGLDGEKLEEFSNSKEFQASLRARNSYERAVDKFGGENEIPVGIVKKILEGEEIFFDADGSAYKFVPCSSDGFKSDVCKQIIGTESPTKDDIIDIIATTWEELEAAVNTENYTSAQQNFALAMQCASNWTTHHNDKSLLIEAKAIVGYDLGKHAYSFADYVRKLHPEQNPSEVMEKHPYSLVNDTVNDETAPNALDMAGKGLTKGAAVGTLETLGNFFRFVTPFVGSKVEENKENIDALAETKAKEYIEKGYFPATEEGYKKAAETAYKVAVTKYCDSCVLTDKDVKNSSFLSGSFEDFTYWEGRESGRIFGEFAGADAVLGGSGKLAGSLAKVTPDFAYLNKLKVNGKVSSADEVNVAAEALGYSPPYQAGTEVVEFAADGNTQFVRVYTDGVTNAEGRWVMRAEDIEGLTPQQIKEKYALPYLPTHVTTVTPPSGTPIRMGTVGENFGSKAGDANQFELLEGSSGWGAGKPLID